MEAGTLKRRNLSRNERASPREVAAVLSVKLRHRPPHHRAHEAHSGLREATRKEAPAPGEGQNLRNYLSGKIV